MAAKFSIGGMAEIRKNLEAVEKKVGNKVVRTALRDAAKRTRDVAREIVPVKEGELLASLKVRAGKRSRKGISMRLVSETDHTVAVEYGTSDTEAQPFMRPAAEETSEQNTQMIVDQIRAGLDAVLKRKS